MNGAQSVGLSILILNKDLPVFPGRAGHEFLHTTHLAKFANHVALVSLIHNKEQESKKKSLEAAGIKLYAWQNPNLLAQSTSIASHIPIFRKVANNFNDFVRTWPRRPKDTYIQDLQYRNLSESLRSALIDRHWNAMIVVQSTCAHWLDHIPRVPLSVLVLHDIRSLVYARQARAATSIWERFLCGLESYMYNKFERLYVHRYDLVVTVSSDDERWVRKHYLPKQLATIPIPVDSEYFTPLSHTREHKHRIVFTGMMDHPPNIDAACFFAREVLPLIQQKVYDAEFWVVGSEPAQKVVSLMSIPGVVITGTVRDIRPFMAQASVIVVPLRYGSGMRNKILEAWGMEKCVVSTTIGAEGLDYHDEEDILIANKANEIAGKVAEVLLDAALRDRLRKGGRTTVLARHHPTTLAKNYYDVLHRAYAEKHKESRPMRLVIDLRWMKPGIAGGIENLARSFLANIVRLDQYNVYTLLVPNEIRYDFDLRSRRNIRVCVADGLGNDIRNLIWGAMKILHRTLGMDYWRSAEVEQLRFLRKLNADAVLSLSGYIYQDMYPVKNVMIAVDLQHEYHPEFFGNGEVESRRRVLSGSVLHSDHIIAISEFTRKSLIEKLNVDPHKVTTVHLAADPIFDPENRRRINVEKILLKYKLKKGSYLFFPGNTWPHKNHLAAVESIRILRDKYNVSIKLVISGALKEGQRTLLDTIKKHGIEDDVEFLGYCPREDVPALYEGAAMLVYPSYFEGFGIPLVEAMLSGCPVVCSNASCLPEIAGDAALFVDPKDSEQLAKAIHQVLTDDALRQLLIVRGREQAKKYSWKRFTLETIQILHNVINNVK